MTPIQPKFGVFNKIYIVRKIINTVIAVVILVGAVFYAQHLIESNERVKPPVKKIIKTCLFVLQDKKLTSYGLMALYFHGL